MRDGLWFTNCDTGRWLCTVTGLAWSTTISNLLSLFVLYKSHWFLTEDINLIGPYFKDFCWTDARALTASVAFVRIDGDIPVAGSILETVIGYHIRSAA